MGGRVELSGTDLAAAESDSDSAHLTAAESGNATARLATKGSGSGIAGLATTVSGNSGSDAGDLLLSFVQASSADPRTQSVSSFIANLASLSSESLIRLAHAGIE